MISRNILKKQYKYLYKIYTILVSYQLNCGIQIELIFFLYFTIIIIVLFKILLVN